MRSREKGGIRRDDRRLNRGFERHDFLVHQFLELFTADIIFVKVEFKELWTKRGADRLVIGVVLERTRKLRNTFVQSDRHT